MPQTKSSAKPLAGMRVLITRAASQAGSLAKFLRERGAAVISVPVIEIVPPKSPAPLDSALRQLNKFDWLILTSANGVDALFKRLQALSISATKMKSVKIAAIGPATRAAIESHGLRVATMPQKYVAEAVVRSLRNKVRGKRVLLVRAAQARDVIPRELRRAGANVKVIAAYETIMPHHADKRLRSAFQQAPPDIVTFTSSSSVRNFIRALPKSNSRLLNSGVALASIGPVTSKTLREHGLVPEIEAREYTMRGLADAIARWARTRKLR